MLFSVFTVNKMPSASGSETILVSLVVVDVVADDVAADVEISVDGDGDLVALGDGFVAADTVVDNVAIGAVCVSKIERGCRGVLGRTTGDDVSTIRAAFATGSVKPSPLRFSPPGPLSPADKKRKVT